MSYSNLRAYHAHKHQYIPSDEVLLYRRDRAQVYPHYRLFNFTPGNDVKMDDFQILSCSSFLCLKRFQVRSRDRQFWKSQYFH